MRTKILIVDDVELNREILAAMLQDEYEIVMAENGKQALAILAQQRNEIALMLLDLVMPEMDGFEVLEVVSRQLWGKQLAIMIISSDNTSQTENRCFELGVSDFIHRPFDEILVKRRVKNVISLYQYQNQLEQKVEEQTGTLTRQHQLLQMQAKQLRQSRENVIDILGTVVEYRNLESGEHVRRVKGYTRILAEELMKRYPEYGLTKEKINVIVAASVLHDIGKITVPDSILLKPGKLTKKEFERMKTHTTKGGDILMNIKNVWDEEYEKASYEICRYHHERYDGKGYPDGLTGEEIPVSAQIVAVADVYDALVNVRVYKSAFSKEKAFQMIISGECGVFSPKLLECFKHVRKEFEKLADESADASDVADTSS